MWERPVWLLGRLAIGVAGFGAVLLAAACDAAAPAIVPSAGIPTAAGSTAGGNDVGLGGGGGSKFGQVTITGAVSTSAGVRHGQWSDFPGDIRVDLTLDFSCGVVIDVPHGTTPGTYPIVDQKTNHGTVVGAEYNDACHGTTAYGDASYESTTGTLTLTSTGDTWSATFGFTAQNLADSSKTVHVSGSFKDVPKV